MLFAFDLSGDCEIRKHHAAIGERVNHPFAMLIGNGLALAVLQGHGYRGVGREVRDFTRGSLGWDCHVFGFFRLCVQRRSRTALLAFGDTGYNQM